MGSGCFSFICVIHLVYVVFGTGQHRMKQNIMFQNMGEWFQWSVGTLNESTKIFESSLTKMNKIKMKKNYGVEL